MEVSGFVALLVAMAVSRIINERGMRRLTPEQKLRLLDGFSAARAYSLIPLLVLVGAFWLLSSRPEVNKQYLAIGYFSLLILFVITRVFLNQRKMGQLDLPQDYRRLFSLSQVVSCLGVAWFFFVMVTHGPMRSMHVQRESAGQAEPGVGADSR